MSLAQRCTNMHTLKPTHAIFISHGLHLNNYAVSKLIAFCALSDSGNLRYASLLFNQVQTPNTYMYNTLIRAHSTSSDPHLAMHCFRLMLNQSDLEPDNFTFHFVILGCVNCGWIVPGRQIHSWVVKNGMVIVDAHVQTALLRLYAECRVLGDVHKGKWIHEYVRKRKGLDSDVFIGTALVDMYAKCGCIDLAVEAKRNVVSWSAMIGAFGVHGYAAEASSFLERMQVDDGIKPDGVVLLGVLMACTHAGLLEKGRLCDAFELIRRMPMKPLASLWGALLSGCRIHNNVGLAEIAVE
ncbi:putative pentatricopeptide [Rosa chinensis]|uniref:Putative pentatricopeptide n=1 Tax=Rosa chinensis TaxID=74649 RepID=A0A2P6SFU7_ROSCH|nr:putative pentatricopeptide [Rosa chinensis]